MARGKLLRTKIRERKALVKADLQATKEWEERKVNFPHHAKKLLIDMLKRVDPLEMMAVGALTVVVHDTIVASSEILDKLKEAPVHVHNWLVEWGGALTNALNSLWGFSPQTFEGTPIKEGEEGYGLEIMSWFLAFALAFIMIRHASGIVAGLVNISSLAMGLLA